MHDRQGTHRDPIGNQKSQLGKDSQSALGLIVTSGSTILWVGTRSPADAQETTCVAFPWSARLFAHAQIRVGPTPEVIFFAAKESELACLPAHVLDFAGRKRRGRQNGAVPLEAREPGDYLWDLHARREHEKA